MSGIVKYDVDFPLNQQFLQLKDMIIKQNSENESASVRYSHEERLALTEDEQQNPTVSFVDLVENVFSSSCEETDEPPVKKKAKCSKHRSKWWKYFNEDRGKNGEKVAVCKYCKNTYKISGTGNMALHMKKHHSNQLPIDLKDHTIQTTPHFKRNQKDLEVPKLDNDRSLQLLVEFVLSNNHPFTIVEEPAFKNFIASINPEFKLLSAKAMKTLISEKYVSKKQDIKEYFKKNSSKLSATTDLFKTTNHLNIMAVTVTWLDEEFTMRNIILGFRPLEDEHSGTDICRLFMEILKEFEIEQKTLCVTTDNVASNSLFVQHLESSENSFESINWIRCFAHEINLAVQEALIFLKPSLDKVRSLVKGVRSAQLLQHLKTKQLEYDLELNNHLPESLSPLLDVPTRWISTYWMIKRALRLRQSLDFIAANEKDLSELQINESEWNIIAICLEFLEPFAVTTKEMESAAYPTLTVVIPLFNALITHIEDWGSGNHIHPKETIDAAKAAQAKLLKYYHKTTDAYVMALMLDPRLKMDYFQDNNWDEDVIVGEITSSLQQTWKKYNIPPSQMQFEDANDDSPSKDIRKDFVSNVYKRSKDKKDDLESYLSIGVEDINESVLMYWKSNARRWPRLSSMARDFLAIPSTSAASECSFNFGGDLQGLSRRNLKPDTMESTMCLRSWDRSGVVFD